MPLKTSYIRFAKNVCPECQYSDWKIKVRWERGVIVIVYKCKHDGYEFEDRLINEPLIIDEEKKLH